METKYKKPITTKRVDYTISLENIARLKLHCDKNLMKVSTFVNHLITQYFENQQTNNNQ